MPLRRWLPLLTAALVALALVVAGLLAATALRSYLVDQVDADLMHSPALTATGPAPPPPGSSPLSSDLFIQEADTSGAVVQQISNLPQGLTAPTLPALTREEVLARGGQPFTTGGWRVVARPTATGSVMVAKPLSGVDDTVRRLVILEVAGGVAVLVVVTALSTWLVRRSLRPLRSVERTALAITAGDLSRRVPAYDPGTEAGEVGGAMNAMLDRLESAFADRATALAGARTSEARMRQFIADASHELRTPLTSVRGLAELHRQGAMPPDSVPDAFARIEEESTRMGLLVEELLLLARLDAERPLERSPVDLLALCGDTVRAVTTPQRPVVLEVLPGSAAPMVLGDGPRLRQVVDNLVSNALQHGRGRVTVRVGTRDGHAVIDVEDEGPGVADEDRERVFDRFYRGGQDRSRATGGSGLGLSIVAALVRVHGGSVAVRGARFTVTLPLAG